MSSSRNATEPPERPSVVPDKQAVTGGFSPGMDFISSIVAGLLLGLLLDWIFDTAPIIVVIGIVAGFISGFLKLWRQSAVLEQQGVRRTLWTGAGTGADGDPHE